MTMTQTSTSMTVRRATREDIPFLAWCNITATSPAPEFCYWDPLLEQSGTITVDFMRAVFAADALAWGRVEEFFVIEEAGHLIAGASAFAMNPDDYRPFRLERLNAVAETLGWNSETLARFRNAYEQVWSDPQDSSLAPQATWIIECVAVIPEARGRGMVRRLFNTLFEEGRTLGHAHVGISVTTGNLAAQRAYENIGFRLHLQYGADYFNDAFPGTTKYRLSLNPEGVS
jgi:ribosomal protein S18 acetylase RimI-like enzyme